MSKQNHTNKSKYETTALLIQDLKQFATTGEGPSPFLDASLKKDRTLYSHLADILFQQDQHRSPLHLAMRISCLYRHHNEKEEYVIKYLLANGAAYIDNESQEREILFRKFTYSHNLYSDPYWVNSSSICQYFLDAGYLPSINHIYNFIPTDYMFSKLYSDTKLLNHMLERSFGSKDLNKIQYYLQKGADITILESHMVDICLPDWDFDALKYFFTHPELKESQGEIWQEPLREAADRNQLQKVHYLVTNYEFSKDILQKIISKLEIKTSVIEYLSAYIVSKDEGELKLKQLERSELDKRRESIERYFDHCRKNEYYEDCFNINDMDFHLFNTVIHLALLNQAHREPSFRNINRLLPINFFAAKYAWYTWCQFLPTQPDEKYTDTLQTMLPFISKHYKHYLKCTNHITEAGIHDNLIKFTFEYSFCRPDFEAAFEAIFTLRNMLPSVISYLIAEYIDGIKNRTPINHILTALSSKKRCGDCKVLLTKEKNLMIFDESAKKLKKLKKTQPLLKQSFLAQQPRAKASPAKSGLLERLGLAKDFATDLKEINSNFLGSTIEQRKSQGQKLIKIYKMIEEILKNIDQSELTYIAEIPLDPLIALKSQIGEAQALFLRQEDLSTPIIKVWYNRLAAISSSIDKNMNLITMSQPQAKITAGSQY